MMTTRSRFDLSDPLVPIRLAAGLLYVPHILFKLSNLAGSERFFGSAGFQPPLAWVILALVMETICAIGLTLDVQTKWVGVLSAGVMAVAGYAIFVTKGVGWLWNLGGVEYLVVWAGVSLLLAAHAWKREQATYGRVFLFRPIRT